LKWPPRQTNVQAAPVFHHPCRCLPLHATYAPVKISVQVCRRFLHYVSACRTWRHSTEAKYVFEARGQLTVLIRYTLLTSHAPIWVILLIILACSTRSSGAPGSQRWMREKHILEWEVGRRSIWSAVWGPALCKAKCTSPTSSHIWPASNR